MRVLVGCEESQVVCVAFRAKGHEAYSCDLQECSGEHPEWHLQMDIFEAFEKLGPWDMVIAFPPCTKLSKAGAAHWKRPGWSDAQWQALKFVHDIMDLPVNKVAIENPVGAINTRIRKPDQRIQPYHYGHPYTKETCLWLKNLPPLRATNVVKPIANWVKPGNVRKRRFNRVPEGGEGDPKIRSKTFPGIAKAMAEQWG
jgi:hypothetical protein